MKIFISIVILMLFFGSKTQAQESTIELYQNYCKSCHGFAKELFDKKTINKNNFKDTIKKMFWNQSVYKANSNEINNMIKFANSNANNKIFIEIKKINSQILGDSNLPVKINLIKNNKVVKTTYATNSYWYIDSIPNTKIKIEYKNKNYFIPTRVGTYILN